MNFSLIIYSFLDIVYFNPYNIDTPHMIATRVTIRGLVAVFHHPPENMPLIHPDIMVPEDLMYQAIGGTSGVLATVFLVMKIQLLIQETPISWLMLLLMYYANNGIYYLKSYYRSFNRKRRYDDSSMERESRARDSRSSKESRMSPGVTSRYPSVNPLPPPPNPGHTMLAPPISHYDIPLLPPPPSTQYSSYPAPKMD